MLSSQQVPVTSSGAVKEDELAIVQPVHFKPLVQGIYVKRQRHSVKTGSTRGTSCKSHCCVWKLIEKEVNCISYCGQNFYHITIVGNHFGIDFTSFRIQITKRQFKEIVYSGFLKNDDLPD